MELLQADSTLSQEEKLSLRIKSNLGQMYGVMDFRRKSTMTSFRESQLLESSMKNAISCWHRRLIHRMHKLGCHLFLSSRASIKVDFLSFSKTTAFVHSLTNCLLSVDWQLPTECRTFTMCKYISTFVMTTKTLSIVKI